MKKARVMLMTIAAMTVLGGALAFKAARFHPANIFCYTGTVNAKAACELAPYQTSIVTIPSTTLPCANVANVGTYSTVWGTSTNCPIFFRGTAYATNAQ